MNNWLKDRKIKAFFSVTQDESFSVGAKNCMNLVGIGKCKLVVFQVTGMDAIYNWLWESFLLDIR